MVAQNTTGLLPYFAAFLPAGLSARNTPIETKRSEVPRVPFEISRIFLKSGIRATKVPAVKPFVINVMVTARRALRRVRSISCAVYPASVELSLRIFSENND